MASSPTSAVVQRVKAESGPAMPAIRSRRLESFTGRAAAGDEEDDRFRWELLVVRIRREFEEMPGLCITLAQGARLFGLPAETCRRIFARLQEDHVLRCTSRGLWVRFDGAV